MISSLDIFDDSCISVQSQQSLMLLDLSLGGSVILVEQTVHLSWCKEAMVIPDKDV
tara:strand:+ start:208 stop:375 length:168 start_codon:yes stop_codon:yes gene_type:complete